MEYHRVHALIFMLIGYVMGYVNKVYSQMIIHFDFHGGNQQFSI